MGGFISEDPARGAGGQPSYYAYVGGDPIDNNDSSGMFLTSVDAACMQSPQLCAEIFGDIARSEGSIQAKLGVACAQEDGDAAASLFNSLGKVAMAAQLGAPFMRSGLLAWSSSGVRNAANDLANGATEVTVGSMSEAEELFMGMYQGDGYRNSTGMSPTEAKDFFGGKSGTYHWDEGENNFPHGEDHLQIHTFGGDVVRIYY